jgi:predicted ATPase/class 3 adenylate cyclase
MRCRNCGFENPTGFAFCGKCGVSLETEDRLTRADLDHLRAYLPFSLIEALQFNLSSPPPHLLEQSIAHLSELLGVICTHLPAPLVEQIVDDPTPGQTGGLFFDGTLLLADISGSTAMSERLSRIGREGAEEITIIVNGYFSAMLAILREHNGQLVKFGGDALLGLFLEPDSATRAVQAALSMQMAMAEFTQTQTSRGMFHLQMKVGIRKGRFFAAQLGTPQRMEYALFGADVNGTAAAESAAMPGQVLLDQATLEAISVPCKAVPVPGSDPYFAVEQVERLEAPSRSAAPPFFPLSLEPNLDSLRQAVKILDALIPYLPAGLLERLASDPHAISLGGEHRLVAVLFANVHGLAEIVDRLGPGREQEIVTALNHYFTAIQDSVHRFGGVINKIDLDDHGDKLLAFFGAPLAHEDDAERAVRAALAMQEALSEISCSLPIDAGLPDLRLSQRISISYGYVVAGYVGTSWRHEYTVMGDEVNLAAHLMSVAEPDSVTISSDVRRKVQALFDLTPRGEVRLKGISDSVPVFSVVGLRAVPESVPGSEGMRSSLVGRETEWNQLLAAMDQLLSRRGQIVSVTGEAGLGKSRLVAEMRQHTANGHGPAVRWIEGRCLSYTESVSFWPFQEIARQIVGLRPEHTKTESWNRLRDSLERLLSPEDASAALPHLTMFLNLPLEDSLQDQVRYLDAEALQQRTFVAIRTLIEAQTLAMSAPLVLVLENIQWLDQASLSLLEHLMPLVNRVPLMLLLVYRPERTKRCWQIHEKVMHEFADRATEIALSPLNPAGSRQLLANLVPLEYWPADMYELILGHTEGNPLYMEEVIRGLVENHILIRDGQGRWQARGGLDSIRVPDTLQGVMMARLDRLEERYRQTLQIASVVGGVFPFDVLAHVHSEHKGQLNQHLAQLQQDEIVEETQRVPEIVYTFIHGMMQEVCYDSLLIRTRRLYHRKIAAYLENSRSVGRLEAESNYPLIAHHAFAGQDWRRALRYQLLAGQRAQKIFANHEAIEHFEKALQSAENLVSAETVEEEQLIHAALGELLTTTGQYEHALEHLHEALSLAVERADHDAQAHACRWLARLHELRGEYRPALEWFQQGLTVLQGRETADAAELLLLAGQINIRQGNYDNALEQCQNALRIAQQLGEVAALARAYNVLGHITYLRSSSVMAIEHFQKSLELNEQAGDIHGQAISHNFIATAYFNTGQWRAADKHYCQAREIFDQTGDVYHCAFADNNLGGIALNQGRLNEALTLYREALRALERIGGSPYVLGVLHMNLGRTFVRRDDFVAAYQHLGISQEYFEQVQARDFLPEMYRWFAEAALLSGELLEAKARGQQALSLAQDLSMREEVGCSLRIMGEIAATQGQLDKAEQHLTESISILKEVGDEYECARSQFSLARLHMSQGKLAEGLTTLNHCQEVFQRLDARLDLANARALPTEASAPQTEQA